MKGLITVTQRATKFARSNTKVLLIELIEAIKIDFGGFFMVGLGFFLRQNDNLVWIKRNADWGGFFYHKRHKRF
jgi:hypothetical protein